MKKGAILLALAALFVAYWFVYCRAIRHAPGVLAPNEPLQTTISKGKPWNTKGYNITPLADFKMKGLVLHTARYWTGRETDLSPVDLALGWGQMSDQSVVDRLSITQDGRWYEFSWGSEGPPISPGEIAIHSANMHILPATAEIDSKLKAVRAGNIVEFSGYLVLCEASDGFRWMSSLTRDDTGAGSCEVVWVTSLEVKY